MNARLVFLGTGAAIPVNRGLPCIALRVGGAVYLLDVGEGCQERLMASGIGVVRVEAVFITHLHGDHYLGLFGLLQTMHMLGRDKPLHVVAPRGLEKILMAHLEHAPGRPGYPVYFAETLNGAVYSDARVSVEAFPVDHTVEAYGYRVRAGKRVIVYTGDTRPCRCVEEQCGGASVLIHEATFTSDMREEAWEEGHSTAADAALTASRCEPSFLVLTHISSRYRGGERLFYDAYRFFRRTVVAEDYMSMLL